MGDLGIQQSIYWISRSLNGWWTKLTSCLLFCYTHFCVAVLVDEERPYLHYASPLEKDYVNATFIKVQFTKFSALKLFLILFLKLFSERANLNSTFVFVLPLSVRRQLTKWVEPVCNNMLLWKKLSIGYVFSMIFSGTLITVTVCGDRMASKAHDSTFLEDGHRYEVWCYYRDRITWPLFKGENKQIIVHNRVSLVSLFTCANIPEQNHNISMSS